MGGAGGKGKGSKSKNFKGFGTGKDGDKKEEKMPHERKYLSILSIQSNLTTYAYKIIC